MSRDTLIDEAVQANVAMTDMSATMDLVNRRLERQLRRMSGLHEVAQVLAQEKDAQGILKLVLKTTIQQLEVLGASISLLSSKEGFREVLLHGFKKDPLLAAQAGRALISRITKDLKPSLIEVGGEHSSPELEALLQEAGYGSALCIPMVARGRVLGLLSAYAGIDRSPLDTEDRELASILATSAAIAYLNARSWQKLEALAKEN